MRIVDEERRNRIFSLIKSHIKDERIKIEPISCTIQEDIGLGQSEITIKINENNTTKTLKGTGTGVVDSVFSAFMQNYSDLFVSLKTISLTEFDVITNLKKIRAGHHMGTDARCEVRISLSNASKNSMLFLGRSRSLLGASIVASVSAYEYYINAEKCFVHLRKLIKDAESRNRGDIVSTLVYDMTDIVSVTNYDCLQVM